MKEIQESTRKKIAEIGNPELNAEGEARNFPSLHIEDVKIDLLSVDEAAGATNIKFGF